MPKDVLIIGGGAIGLCAAYFLAQGGARVRLVERARLGAGASGSSASLLEFQTDTDRDADLFLLAGLSRDLFPKLEAEVRASTGDDFGFEACGIVNIALNEGDVDALRAKVEFFQEAGLRAEWFSREELRRSMPQLNAEHLGGALFGEDGQIVGERFLTAMAAAARKAGVVIEENTGEVVVERRCGLVVARTDQRTYDADAFVVAAGAWSAAVVAPLNVELPVTPVKGQLAVYDSPVPDLPRPVYTRNGGYVAPKHSHMIVGTTVEKTGFDAGTTPDGRAALEGRTGQMLGIAPSLHLRETVAGLRPATPDLLPVIGFLPEWPSVLVASGHYRNGMLLAPATGVVVRDLVLGRPLPLDIAAFRPDRFRSDGNLS